ncbi:MAG: RluA family pseudouridine synthase [Elusimicrobia bacterium]|nr:RluA family pseudouridine synthase [Elusimicrobiota bacterium]
MQGLINLALPWQHLVEKPIKPRRLDLYLAGELADSNLSRSTIQRLIHEGWVKLAQGKNTEQPIFSPAHRIQKGDHLKIIQPGPTSPPLSDHPLKLSVLFENNDFLAIDKPPGLITHPTSSLALKLHANLADRLGMLQRPSVLTWILHHLPANNAFPRYGIVHRLDAATSGVLLIAKTQDSYEILQRLFKKRQMTKTYLALVHGVIQKRQFEINSALTARYGRNRMTMALAGPGERSRSAATTGEVIKTYNNASFLKVYPSTGRTHQIRLHLSSIGHPVLGDPLYGRKTPGHSDLASHSSFNPQPATRNPQLPVSRLMLHAWKIRFTWPVTSRMIEIRSPLPADFRKNFLFYLKQWPPL